MLPSQERPVVMNTKGPSASGKSTIRPLQRTLAGYIGVAWSEFALISPDIWRKQLIDYGSLGAHYKYAGAFTGDELAIIDRKLDDYMARKGERGIVPHLLIDRFRFDSFAPHSDEPGSNLLTRFGQVVYLFFLITPPASHRDDCSVPWTWLSACRTCQGRRARCAALPLDSDPSSRPVFRSGLMMSRDADTGPSRLTACAELLWR